MSVVIEQPFNSPGMSVLAQNRKAYSYPEGLNLQPDSDQHQKLVGMVMRRAQASHTVMKRRHASWDQVDKTLTAYIPTDEAERASQRRDSRKPVSIVVPITYTVKQVLLTHLIQSRAIHPYLRYMGQGPEDHVGAILLENIVNSQFIRAKAMLNIISMWGSAIAYGFGGVSCIWESEVVKKMKTRDTGFFSSALSGPDMPPTFWPTGKEKYVGTDICEGNKLVNIDPRRYLPDTNVPIHEVRNAEYTGWVERTNLMRLIKLENRGEAFNIHYLRSMQDGRSRIINLDDNARDRDGLRNEGIADETRTIDVIWMYIHLIPSECGLGSSTDPECWLLGVAADMLLVSAVKMEQTHGRIPLAVAAPNYDGHVCSPISDLETTLGIQKVADFKMNSHVAAIRQMIRGKTVYDPSQINTQDMETPGKDFIRARARSFGQDLRKAVFPFPVQDPTQKNFQDLGYLNDMIQRVTGATDMLQGIDNNAPERRTAQEANGLRQSALGRVEKMARIMALQADHEIAYLFAEHTQQYMSQDAWAKALGSWPQILAAQYGPNAMIPVSPTDIVVNYDILPTDTGVMGGESLQSSMNVFQMAIADPEIRQKFDVTRLFEDVARMSGFKNVQDYARMGGDLSMTTMPMEQIQGQVDSGQLAPMPQIAGAA